MIGRWMIVIGATLLATAIMAWLAGMSERNYPPDGGAP